MKIQLNGIIKDYSAQEVKALQQQGHRFQLSKKLGVYVPVPIQIHENGGTRDTGMDELVRRKATGEKFLKASGQTVMDTFRNGMRAKHPFYTVEHHSFSHV